MEFERKYRRINYRRFQLHARRSFCLFLFFLMPALAESRYSQFQFLLHTIWCVRSSGCLFLMFMSHYFFYVSVCVAL